MKAGTGHAQSSAELRGRTWSESTIGEAAEVQSGATPSTRVAAFWNGEIPWCTPTDITATAGKYLYSTQRSITQSGLDSCSAPLLPPGTLLLCSRATIGEVKISTASICTNQGFKSLVCRHAVSNQFFYYLLLALKPQMLERSIGSTFLEIGKRDLASISILLPPKHEQEAIAEALSDADALIEMLEQLIAKKRQIKQGAMQQLLTGRKRLPGFEEDWETLPLEKVAEIRSGGTPSTTNSGFWDGGIAWCTPTDITALRGRKYLVQTERTISNAGLRASSAEVIPPYSTVMTTRATIGECALNKVPITTNQGFKNLIPIATDAHFLYYLMTTQKERLIQLCAGSTFLEVGKKQLQKLHVTLPTALNEQHAIANVLSDMDAEIAELKAKLEKAREVKQGMMQQLLTGRIRLVEPQRQPIAEADAATI